MTRVMVLYPLDDVATSVSAYFGDRIASALEEKGLEVIRFDTWKATRLLFQLQQFVRPADFIVYSGHGNRDRWHGSLTMGGLIWPLIDLLNKGLLRDKLCYAIACRTGLQLGKEAPTRAYLGWNVDVYVALPMVERNYLEDFLEAFMRVPLVLAEGKTAREAGQAFLARFMELKRLYDANLDLWPNADFYSMAAENNMNGFEVLGDPEARIS